MGKYTRVQNMQNITNNSQYVRGIIYYCARCCVILAIFPACCLFELAALGQHELRSSVHQDPEQLALNIKYDKQKQDEDNIRIQELTVEAFRQEARKIRRNLEALSFTPSSEMTPKAIRGTFEHRAYQGGAAYRGRESEPRHPAELAGYGKSEHPDGGGSASTVGTCQTTRAC